MSELNAERVREVLDYNAENGEFRWRVAARGVKAGNMAGCKHHSGYVHIKVDGRQYRANRLAWLHVYGHWPRGHIDHINGSCGDNRIVNLRECNDSENQQNRRAKNRNNTSGLPGVFTHKQSGRWRAQIKIDRKVKHLGLFDTAEEAHAAYLRAKTQLHPFQTTTGSPQ